MGRSGGLSAVTRPATEISIQNMYFEFDSSCSDSRGRRSSTLSSSSSSSSKSTYSGCTIASETTKTTISLSSAPDPTDTPTCARDSGYGEGQGRSDMEACCTDTSAVVSDAHMLEVAEALASEAMLDDTFWEAAEGDKDGGDAVDDMIFDYSEFPFAPVYP